MAEEDVVYLEEYVDFDLDGEEEEDDDDDEDEDDEESEEEDVDGDVEEEEGEVENLEIEDSSRESSRRNSSGYAEEEREKRRKVERETNTGDESKEESQESQWNRSEIEGLFCPICMEAWTSEGDHHISCLPCGHIFGFSCITRWLKQSRSSAKCPQCNRKSTLKDIRKLFAPRIAVVDEDSQKRIQYLEAKCASLEKERSNWCKKLSEWEKKEVEWQRKVKNIEEKANFLEHQFEVLQNRPSNVCQSCERIYTSGNFVNSTFDSQGSWGSFFFQRELQVDGARLFDIDASGNQVLLLARKSRMGGSYILTKISLIPPHEKEDIFLPSRTKIIKDLHISPLNKDLALFVSLGKEISVISMESNNIILSYDLPVPAWSCSWDMNSSNFIYAGLQNGSLLVFDVRQTTKPVESKSGLSTNPIHTIHSLHHDPTLPSGVRTVLSASSIGVCQWNFGGAEERPLQVPETTNQGVCIALAHCSVNDDVVASYRPRVEMPDATAASQPVLTPPFAIGQGVRGSHLHLKRVGSNFQKLGTGYGIVSNIRLPRTTIFGTEKQKPLFATGDEVSNGLIMQELPSFTVAQRLKSHKHFICDVKYTSTSNQGLLGCLSEDTLQLFSTELV